MWTNYLKYFLASVILGKLLNFNIGPYYTNRQIRRTGRKGNNPFLLLWSLPILVLK
jgi:hypothetical protein